MRASSFKIFSHAASATALSCLVLPSDGLAQRRSDGVFKDFVGSWSGTGTISMANGTTERIRCRAVYALGTGANNLRSTVRCASDSYKFELNSDVTQQAGVLSGAWRETTRSISGVLSGSASPGQINARIEAPGFSASLSLAARAGRQSVVLRSRGTELAGINIALRRR